MKRAAIKKRMGSGQELEKEGIKDVRRAVRDVRDRE